MDLQIEMPTQRLAKEAVNVWRIRETISHVIALLLLVALFVVDAYFHWVAWIELILWGITALTVISAIWSIGIHPFLIYKNFRYDVSESFLQIKSGAIHEIHELIPMTKIQSVATNQGPLMRRYHLYSVEIRTMGSGHQIPALPKEIATALREQIAQYAKLKEVEQ